MGMNCLEWEFLLEEIDDVWSHWSHGALNQFNWFDLNHYDEIQMIKWWSFAIIKITLNPFLCLTLSVFNKNVFLMNIYRFAHLTSLHMLYSLFNLNALLSVQSSVCFVFTLLCFAYVHMNCHQTDCL